MWKAQMERLRRATADWRTISTILVASIPPLSHHMVKVDEHKDTFLVDAQSGLNNVCLDQPKPHFAIDKWNLRLTSVKGFCFAVEWHLDLANVSFTLSLENGSIIRGFQMYKLKNNRKNVTKTHCTFWTRLYSICGNGAHVVHLCQDAYKRVHMILTSNSHPFRLS